MSIDLGSEWVKVGVVSPGVPMEIALNKESKRKTPSILAFRDGVRTFGEDAASIGVRFPANAYFYLTDLLGKTVDNPIVQLYRNRFPYYDIVPDEERNTVVFKSGDDLYKVEELVAQILLKAKEFAEDSTGQQITECVIIVPGFFGQSERAAVITAAQLANVKVLQLINDYTAVALNFGVFRRGQINETAQYYIFYDMGAQKTSAAVVSYQLVKDKATRETNPVIQILGVGYDRTLGGLDIQLRLRDFLAKEFNKMGKTKTDVTKNPRALAKLFKEAGRLKNVLSANADHYAQIENLIEDHDFRLQVTREQLNELCSDLWPRVQKPLEQALKMAGLSMDVIEQVILFGGGTRVPKVQEILKGVIKQDLGKSLNADEAATMGAVYRAADLATGFKVKKFIIKDAVLFPIQVVFERELGEGGDVKQVRRILFGQMNAYPQKKVITFNKHTDDFTFNVNYADLNHLSPQEVANIGKLNLSHVELKNVAKAFEKHKGENVESKGIKAHFFMGDSGLFDLTGVEFVFEKQKVGDDSDDESTLSKLGSTISKLFSGEKSETKEEANKTQEATENVNKTDTQSNTTQSAEAPKNETVKLVTIKEPVEYNSRYLYTPPLTGSSFDKSQTKVEEITKIERERTRRESALNALESHVIDAREKLSNEEYSNCATQEEIEKILAECTVISDWLYEDGEDADAEAYEKRLNELRVLTNEVYARHWEHQERPEALKALTEMISGAEKFLVSAMNLTKDTNPEKDVFTQVEIDTLSRVITETIDWQKTETEEQEKLKPNEAVRLTVKSITDKMALLDREVKYLVNKIKYWRPKKPAKKAKGEKADNTTADTEGPGSGSEASPEGDQSPPTQEEPPLDVDETPFVTEPSSEEAKTPHGEL